MIHHWFTTYLTDHYSKNKKLGLDIGCGKKPYKDIFNCDYVGIDFRPKQQIDPNDKPNFFASGEYLPFKDNTFDFLTNYSVIPYVENIDQFLNEMYRVMKNDGIAVIIIMNLKALSKTPNKYYPNRFTSKQLESKLNFFGFKSIKFYNPKTFVWSTYFDKTSVYSYAIVKCAKKNIPKHTIKPIQNKSSFFLRRKIRTKLKSHNRLSYISQKYFQIYCISTHNFHTLPTFLIIGAAKCGTSSLYDYLMQHPSVERSLTKQLHFFDRYFNKNIPWYKTCFPFIWKKFIIEKIHGKKFACGEATAHYMTHPLSAKRAYSVIPNVKIIVMLRNPVDRAYSHYNMEKANGKENLSFEESIKKEPERIKGEFEEMLDNKNNSGRNYPHRAYVKSGEYLDQIKIWQKFFPPKNFLYIKTEEFNKNPSKVYHDVLNFLGLSVFELKNYQKSRKRNYEKINLDTRQKLIDYFKPHNKKLYDHLGINFDWEDVRHDK